MTNFKILIITVSFFFLSISNVHAGLVGVSQIKVTQSSTVTGADPYWLQVSEVVATETGTGNDLALTSAGASATGSSVYINGSATPDKAIDGFGPLGYPNFFHSGEGNLSSWLLITLSTVSELDSITIIGRADCCTNRDIYDVEFLNAQGRSLYLALGLDASGSSHLATSKLPNTSVPEPGTLALMGLGLAGIGYRRHRRKMAA